MKILVVEDEKAIANAIKRILEDGGYTVDTVYDGLSGLDYAKAYLYDLLILDVMLPKLDGFEIVRILRKDGMRVPILMLTARGATRDKVTGLNYGADDYMTKPFEAEELVARVGALTRRTGDVIVNEVKYEDLVLDLTSAMLSCGEQSVRLSKKEFEVARMFFMNPTMTITKELLIVNVWGMESDATDNNVEAYISFLRRKMKYLGSKVTLKNSQKIGYRLETAHD